MALVLSQPTRVTASLDDTRNEHHVWSDDSIQRPVGFAASQLQLTEDEKRIVNEERSSHPNLQVRDKMWTIWFLHCGLTRQKAAEIVGDLAPQCSDMWMPTAKADWTDYGVRNVQRPTSELAAFRDIIRASWKNNPPARSPRRATESRI